MALMNTMKGSGPEIREVGGDGCTLLMDPSMKGSGHMGCDTAKDCCFCVSIALQVQL